MEKKQYIKIIEDYINYFAQDIPIEEFRRMASEKNNNENIVIEIHKDLVNKCKKYLKKEIGPKELKDYAANMLFKKYNPNILRDTLSDRVYDFLLLLDEFLFFREEEQS